MLRLLAALCLALPILSAHAATYHYAGSPATYVSNSITCAVPHDCAQYTLGQQVVTGQFTTAAPLAPNLADADIIPDLAGYSFNGSRFVIDSSSPASRVNTFRVSTDASGAITSVTINLHRWTYSAASSPPAGPHVDGDRRNEIYLFPSGASFAAINLFCLGAAIGTSVDGTGDTCLASGADSFASSGIAEAGGVWRVAAPAAASAVPALSEWALALLALACAALGMRQWRRE